jgi:AcrR family transcriptional regulator
VNEPAPRPARRRGRRPAGEDRRGDILAAARAEFASRGYDATTLRGVARVAAVDARLVHHYFEGKDALFTAAFELPLRRPHDLFGPVLAAGPDGVGERLVRMFLRVWDAPEGRQRVVALLGASATSEAGSRMLREFLTAQVFGPIAAALGDDEAELRATLAASQMGLVVARYVVRLEPLASAAEEDLVAVLAPTLQRYLTGPLRIPPALP